MTLEWESVLGRVIIDHRPSLYVVRERAQFPSWYKDNRLSTREKWMVFPLASCRSYINVRRDIKEVNRVQNKSSLCGTNPSTAGHPFSLAASTQWPGIVPTDYEANNASISKILQWEPPTWLMSRILRCAYFYLHKESFYGVVDNILAFQAPSF